MSAASGLGWGLVLSMGGLLVAPASGQQTEPEVPSGIVAESAPSACAGNQGYASCRDGCEPGKLIFLPCMAVGARGMAACRQQEVAACLRACASRHCS